MGVFTFVCRNSGAEWTAKQYSGDLEGSAASTYELQRKLVQTALAVDSSGGVQSSFSYISPTSAVFQVFLIYIFYCIGLSSLFFKYFWCSRVIIPDLMLFDFFFYMFSQYKALSSILWYLSFSLFGVCVSLCLICRSMFSITKLGFWVHGPFRNYWSFRIWSTKRSPC